MQYSKIQTLFKRDIDNLIIPSLYTLPEFKYLENCLWECTEKIDGTNIRIEIDWKSEDDFVIEFKGRTDKALIPAHLLGRLYELFGNLNLNDIFKFTGPQQITIYGEGYGVKIQNGGYYIKDGVDFILFDIRVGDWWLSRASLEEIAAQLNVKIVPIIGYFTLPGAIEYVKKGFISTISEDRNYMAEGLVLKTPNGLKLRSGERIITKLKTTDFVKFRNKFGKEENPEQIVNSYSK